MFCHEATKARRKTWRSVFRVLELWHIAGHSFETKTGKKGKVNMATLYEKIVYSNLKQQRRTGRNRANKNNWIRSKKSMDFLVMTYGFQRDRWY